MSTVRPVSVNPATMGDHELLTPSEERALARRIRAGAAAVAELASGAAGEDLHAAAALGEVVADGAEARRELVRANVRLVLRWARKFRPSSMALEDAVQEGTVGLLRAATNFDPDAGYRFSTYATFYIKQAVLRGADATCRPVRLSHTASELLSQIQRASEDPNVSMASVAAEVALTGDHVADLLRVNRAPVSLSDADHGPDPADLTATPAAIVEARLVSEEIAGTLDALPTAERDVLARRFGLGEHHVASAADVAAALELTRDEVLELEISAFKMLRGSARARDILAA